MNSLFNDILSGTASELTFSSAMIAMLAALFFGLAIAFTYLLAQNDNYQRSMAVTLLMLPVILSVIILFVGSNVARAFSLAGTLSIIRFRSAPGDPKDIGFIFFDIAAGLSAGVGLYGYGGVFVIFLCAVILLSEKLRLFDKKVTQKSLKITIPESLNFSDAFDEVLKKYTEKYTLTGIKTTDLGSLFELSYAVAMRDDVSEQAFLNEIRCRNGNLTVALTLPAQPKLK